jgi:hypothetical protein
MVLARDIPTSNALVDPPARDLDQCTAAPATVGFEKKKATVSGGLLEGIALKRETRR